MLQKTCEVKGDNGINNDAFNPEVSKDFSNGDIKVFQNGKEPNGFKDAEVGNESAVKVPYKPGTNTNSFDLCTHFTH